MPSTFHEMKPEKYELTFETGYDNVSSRKPNLNTQEQWECYFTKKNNKHH